MEAIPTVCSEPLATLVQGCKECVVAHDRAEQSRLRYDVRSGLELIGVEARDDRVHGVEHRHARIYPWRFPPATGRSSGSNPALRVDRVEHHLRSHKPIMSLLAMPRVAVWVKVRAIRSARGDDEPVWRTHM